MHSWLYLCNCNIGYFIVTARPDTVYLMRYVREPLCAEGPTVWYDVGLTLIGEGGKNKLKIIKNNPQLTINERCDAMFDLWKMRDTEASWNKLIEAFEKHELTDLVEDLKKKLGE